jgi:replicative DNA helicase
MKSLPSYSNGLLQPADNPLSCATFLCSLPFSEDSEKGLVCSLLLCPGEVAPECALKIQPDHFYLPETRIIYEAAMDALEQKKPIDFVSLKSVIVDRNQLDSIGGPEYLSHIYGFIPTWENYANYAAIVREKWQRREATLEGHRVIQLLFDGTEDAERVLSRHLDTITNLLSLKGCGEIRPFKEHVWETLEVIEERIQKKDITKIRFGIPALDQHLGGLEAGRLHAISGGTSSGKSCLAEQAVINAATQNRPVALFSLEMNPTEVVERALCSVGNIPMSHINRGEFDQAQYKRLNEAVLKIAPLPIFIDERFLVDINAIISRTRELHARYKIELLVIDYIQLIECSSAGRQATRELQLSEATRKLQILTKELKIATLIMSQVNEDGDLKHCKAIAEHSDVWIHMAKDLDREHDDKARILRVRKGRQIGTTSRDIPVSCDGQFMRFTENSIRPVGNESHYET